jgi:hypothetical protein
MCHLPVNNRQEEKAFFGVISYLKELRERAIGVTGWTTSSLRPAAFHGWWSEENEEWVRDSIVLCFVDYHLPFDHPDLARHVEELKKTIRTLYRKRKSPQEEVWVVAYQVVRQD